VAKTSCGPPGLVKAAPIAVSIGTLRLINVVADIGLAGREAVAGPIAVRAVVVLRCCRSARGEHGGGGGHEGEQPKELFHLGAGQWPIAAYAHPSFRRRKADSKPAGPVVNRRRIYARQPSYDHQDVSVAMGQYQELRRLAPPRIDGLLLAAAAAYLVQNHSPDLEPSRGLDLDLHGAATTAADPEPLLCLRCRISHPMEAWLRATHSRYGESYGLDLLAMASYALDDTGSLSIRIGPNTAAPFTYAEIASLPKGLISPFSAEVIRTYDPDKCGLPHWARLKLQCHNDLKAYFREHGLLLISDWALLADSSAKRVRESWEVFGGGGFTAEQATALMAAYKPLYRQAMQAYRQSTGKASGWQPDAAFLQALSPEQAASTTMEQLQAIAAAIRRLQSGRWQQGAALDQELADQLPAPEPEPEPDEDPAQLRALIDQALQRAMEAHMPSVLSTEGRHRDLLRCLWAGWAEGMSNRPLAERCGTSCGTVSKRLRPTEHATTIATAAAVELRRHPAFASCSQSVEAAERLVEALRNHLLEPEREGDVAPLRRWIQQYLSNR
jgi:hypothetical protein